MKLLRPMLVVALLVAACGGTDPAATTTPTTQPSAAEPPTTRLPTTTTQPPPTPTTSTTLPGEMIDFGPVEGDILMVIGVAHDDVLNVRSAPGVDHEVVATLVPNQLDVVARGETRQIPAAFWIAVDVDGTTGWVNLRYIGYEGATDDLTHIVVEEVGYPTTATMTELGLVVAKVLASEDPPSDIVLVVEESAGDLGEVTYDIIGLGDDALRGLRAHVFGHPSDEGFSLKSVEVTSICGRGVTEDGLCP